MFLYLSSSEAPLEIKMHWSASVSIPIIGLLLRDFFEANEGMNLEATRTMISVHEQWLLTMVDTFPIS